MVRTIIILCLLICYNYSFSQHLDSIYKAEVGVKEVGWNRGKRVEEYLKAAKLAPGNPWCAAFVVWCHQKAGYKIVVTGYSPLLFPQNRIVKNPIQGDVFGIYYANKNRIAHVGFIDQVFSNYYITVEGNTGPDGGREGNGVYYKRRLKKQVYKISRWTN